MQVECIDEAPGAARAPAISLRLKSPEISVRELIQARVELEVEALNAELDGQDALAKNAARRWLVQPDRIEVMLNGDRGAFGPVRGAVAPGRRFDPQAMIDVALKGFERGSFFVFVDEAQVLTLDEKVSLGATSEVVFLKLIPLTSG
jgi:hypothetical protein